MHRSKTVAAAVCLLLVGCLDLGGPSIDHDEAQDRLVSLVNESLDAGLQDRERPSPMPPSDLICTDKELAATGKVYSDFSYTFPYSALQIDGASFAEKSTDFLRKQGMEIVINDAPGRYQRFAESDDGFHVLISVLEDVDQIHVGGSGPCVEPPE